MSNLGDALRILGSGLCPNNITHVALSLSEIADLVEADERKQARPLERLLRLAGQYDEADTCRQAYDCEESGGAHRGYVALVAVFARGYTDPELWAAVERHGR